MHIRALRRTFARLSALALRNRRDGLLKLLPPGEIREILRGSLTERFLTCGKPDCRCARGELSVSLDQSHRTGTTLPADQLEQVRRGIASYHRVSEHLEQISDINRELLRRAKGPRRARRKMRK
ncbi:MAG: hypothetical protein DMG40_21670 [Acidobacteria bacterium]|nr:MAG: hypothetical protein DMG40_21670 [Acidobacteriota bacterium]